MSRRSSSVTWLVVALAVTGLAVLAVAGLGAFGTTTEVTQESPVVVLPSGSSAGPVVMSKHDDAPGLSLFGIEFGDHTYIVSVGFVPPDGCVPAKGEPFEAVGACASVPVSGVAAGGGTLPGGEIFMVVNVEISGECFAAIEPGEPWPSTHEGCPG